MSDRIERPHDDDISELVPIVNLVDDAPSSQPSRGKRPMQESSGSHARPRKYKRSRRRKFQSTHSGSDNNLSPVAQSSQSTNTDVSSGNSSPIDVTETSQPPTRHNQSARNSSSSMRPRRQNSQLLGDEKLAYELASADSRRSRSSRAEQVRADAELARSLQATISPPRFPMSRPSRNIHQDITPRANAAHAYHGHHHRRPESDEAVARRFAHQDRQSDMYWSNLLAQELAYNEQEQLRANQNRVTRRRRRVSHAQRVHRHNFNFDPPPPQPQPQPQPRHNRYGHYPMHPRSFAMGHLLRHLSSSFYMRYGQPQRDVDQMSYEELLELGSRLGEVKRRGASVTQISMLPVSKFVGNKSNSEQSCAVCMDEYEKDQDIRTLPCFHFFHTDCIDQWLKQKAECPVCKTSINSY